LALFGGPLTATMVFGPVVTLIGVRLTLTSRTIQQ